MPQLRVEVVGPDSFEDCFAIRREVFVAGQGVPDELEVDGLDPECIHVLAHLEGRPVGTARLRHVESSAKAERVAVLDPHQGRGIGRALMAALEAEARGRGFAELFLHAQQAVIGFYEKLGYAGEGEIFEEAGIPHLAMRKKLCGGLIAERTQAPKAHSARRSRA